EPGGHVRGGGRAAGGGGAQPGGAPEDRAGGAGDRRHGCAALRAGLPDAQAPAGGIEVLGLPKVLEKPARIGQGECGPPGGAGGPRERNRGRQSVAILAISYEFGSGAEEIGRAVEAQLGYEYIALGRVLDEAKKAGGTWERFSREYG